MRITKTGPASVDAGDDVSYTLVVTNNGPNAASGVSVADVTPPGLTFVSNTGACTTPFPCTLGTLAAGQSAAIIATFAVPAGYTTPNPIVNTASVSSAGHRSRPGEQLRDGHHAGCSAQSRSRDHQGPATAAQPGRQPDYTIVVTNHGPSDAPDATVADPTPAGLTFVSNAGACATAFPCSLGPIPAGQSRTITTTSWCRRATPVRIPS